MLRAAARPGAVDKLPSIRFMYDLMTLVTRFRVHPEVQPYSMVHPRSFHDRRNKKKKGAKDYLIAGILGTAITFQTLGLEQPYDLVDANLKYNSKGIEVVSVPRKVSPCPP